MKLVSIECQLSVNWVPIEMKMTVQCVSNECQLAVNWLWNYFEIYEKLVWKKCEINLNWVWNGCHMSLTTVVQVKMIWVELIYVHLSWVGLLAPQTFPTVWQISKNFLFLC